MLGHRDAFTDLARVASGMNANLLLDIGCHNGATIQRFRESGVECEIVGFDPLGTNLVAAKALLAEDRQTRFVEAALSDNDGQESFFVNRNEQTSSLLDNDVGNIVSMPVDSAHIEHVEVLTLTLDAWFAASAQSDARVVIKCDVQGAEGRVIRGGMNVFKNNVAAFYGEIMMAPMYREQDDFQELRRLLENECGLVLFNLYPCLRDQTGRVIQMDGLWVRPDCLRHLISR